MTHVSKYLTPLRNFVRDRKGSLAMEAVIVIPFLVWTYLGLFTLFDGYRHLNANTASVYTLSDLLSRETESVTPTYLNGMNAVHKLMTASPGDTKLRVTVVHYDKAEDKLVLDWSNVSGAVEPYTDNTLGEIAGHLPELFDAETVIVVEAWTPFQPMTQIFVEPFEFHALTVTSPRFAPQLIWEG